MISSIQALAILRITNMRLHILGLLVMIPNVYSTVNTTEIVTSSSSTVLPELQTQLNKDVIEQRTSIEDNTQCECVPYYECDSAVTPWGWGDLDISGSSTYECQSYMDVCCQKLKDPNLINRNPDPTKLRGCGFRNPDGIGINIPEAPTQFGEFPWVIALLNTNTSKYIGSGVLISPEVVMTGAHIVQQYTSGGLKIRAGEWDSLTTKEIFEYQERNVQEIYVHNDFKRRLLLNDIALLRLERPLELTEHINVICLPEQDEDFDNHKNCISNKWGTNIFGNQDRYTAFLKKMEYKMLAHEQCNMMLKKTRLGTRFDLHSSFICASTEDGQNACIVDTGASLVCPLGNDRYKLTGLMDWSIGCGKDVPAVHVNVPKFRHWVDEKMAEWGLNTSMYKIKSDN